MSTSKHRIAIVLLGCMALPALLGCRGEISSKPPVHLVSDMDFQPKLKAQAESHFPGWTDGRGMRRAPAGTIARDQLRGEDPDPDRARLYVYKRADGSFVTTNPLPRNIAALERGQERFRINCAVCHGENGRGRGIVALRLVTRPPSLVAPASDDHSDVRNDWERIKGLSDGEIFGVITDGKSTMPSYAPQVSVEDRWAIVHYLRALQHRAAGN